MKQIVQFIPNDPNNLYCLQAAYMMIAKFFDPTFDIPMEKWAILTGFDKSTWASAGLLWFSTHGYDVQHVSLFDYPQFVERGGEYLLDLCGPEVAAWQISHSNIPAEQQRAQQLLDAGIVVKREPVAEDIRYYLDAGYLLRPMVNSCKLVQKPGYTGHAVVLFGYDEQGVYMHDPGLPPRPNLHVSWDDFEAAWADPNRENKELDSIKMAV